MLSLFIIYCHFYVNTLNILPNHQVSCRLPAEAGVGIKSIKGIKSMPKNAPGKLNHAQSTVKLQILCSEFQMLHFYPVPAQFDWEEWSWSGSN